MTALSGSGVRICTAGRYKGERVQVLQAHHAHWPTLYTCKVLSNGKEIALREDEIANVCKEGTDR